VTIHDLQNLISRLRSSRGPSSFYSCRGLPSSPSNHSSSLPLITSASHHSGTRALFFQYALSGCSRMEDHASSAFGFTFLLLPTKIKVSVVRPLAPTSAFAQPTIFKGEAKSPKAKGELERYVTNSEGGRHHANLDSSCPLRTL
jgi:hypothetical protein